MISQKKYVNTYLFFCKLQQWYEVVTPHLLDGARLPRPTQPDHVNKLDWSVFKSKKSHKSKVQKDTNKEPNKESLKKKETDSVQSK